MLIMIKVIKDVTISGGMLRPLKEFLSHVATVLTFL